MWFLCQKDAQKVGKFTKIGINSRVSAFLIVAPSQVWYKARAN
jgi:hypothetical protein